MEYSSHHIWVLKKMHSSQSFRPMHSLVSFVLTTENQEEGGPIDMKVILDVNYKTIIHTLILM